MSEQNNNKSKKKMNKGLKVILIIISVILAIIIIAGAALLIMYNVGKNELYRITPAEPIAPPEELKEEVTYDQDGMSVYYKGEKYKYNESVIPILILGVDKYSFDDNEGIGYNGQADAVYLAILNTETKAVNILSLSRDSMVDVNMYSHGDSFLRTQKMQLCLAYAYGDGRGKSCENVATSVSRLLCNIPISSYMAIDFDAIPVVNDAVGGVTVPEYTDDGMQPTGNTVTLYGQQAVRYLRFRMITEFNSNAIRVERQKTYINAFVKKAVAQTKENITLPLNLYNSISDYMVTNIGASQITYLAANYLEGASNFKMYSIPGTVEKVNNYIEFTPDSTALYETVLELFYTKQ